MKAELSFDNGCPERSEQSGDGRPCAAPSGLNALPADTQGVALGWLASGRWPATSACGIEAKLKGHWPSSSACGIKAKLTGRWPAASARGMKLKVTIHAAIAI